MNQRVGEVQSTDYNFAFLDEGSKREIRRSVLKAVSYTHLTLPTT